MAEGDSNTESGSVVHALNQDQVHYPTVSYNLRRETVICGKAGSMEKLSTRLERDSSGLRGGE